MEDKTASPKQKIKERITLHKEYRLIERNEAEISGSWKGNASVLSHNNMFLDAVFP